MSVCRCTSTASFAALPSVGVHVAGLQRPGIWSSMQWFDRKREPELITSGGLVGRCQTRITYTAWCSWLWNFAHSGLTLAG